MNEDEKYAFLKEFIKNESAINYFQKMQNLSKIINVKELSMGMSGDYVAASEAGATFLRIGSKIFGERD